MAPLDLSRNSQEWGALTGFQHKTLKDLRRDQRLGHQQSSSVQQESSCPMPFRVQKKSGQKSNSYFSNYLERNASP